MQPPVKPSARLAGALAKAQFELLNPEKIADRHHPLAISAEGCDLPLTPRRQRPRYRPKALGPARDCDHPDHRDRRGSGQIRLTTLLVHASGSGFLRLAGLCGQRTRPPASDGELHSPLPAATRCSRWLGSPGKTIWMRLRPGVDPHDRLAIGRAGPTSIPHGHPHTRASQMRHRSCLPTSSAFEARSSARRTERPAIGR